MIEIRMNNGVVQYRHCLKKMGSGAVFSGTWSEWVNAGQTVNASINRPGRGLDIDAPGCNAYQSAIDTLTKEKHDLKMRVGELLIEQDRLRDAIKRWEDSGKRALRTLSEYMLAGRGRTKRMATLLMRARTMLAMHVVAGKCDLIDDIDTELKGQ